MILLVLIVLNLGVIFFFSNQNAASSGAVSNAVSRQIEIRTPNYAAKNQGEKNVLHTNVQRGLRQGAHVALFFSLGVLVCLFLWERSFFTCQIAGGVLFGILCGIGDEIHQLFVPGRTFQWQDIGNDILGYLSGMLLCGLVFGIIRLRTRKTAKKESK